MTEPVAIKIGTPPETLKEVSDNVMKVILSPAGDKVKIAAIEALTRSLTVSHVSISDVHVNMPIYNGAAQEEIEEEPDDSYNYDDQEENI